ncbi:MAG: 4Fe-4S binding protein [Firmicutes bacterium]|nr:4Fe-4S binding protein [Bacillota bacterium]
MKQLVILSGKGGTGKTTVAASLIWLAKQCKAFTDCDVDAPNLHLSLNADRLQASNSYYGYQKAHLDRSLCLECGRCAQYCRFAAIKDYAVVELLCEGCSVCEIVCPAKDAEGRSAIRLYDSVTGWTCVAQTEHGLFSTGWLKMGNGASGKLIATVRGSLKEKITDEELVIIDGSPGTGCPVMASVTGTDFALLVAEPTLSGLHDLSRIVPLVRRFTPHCAVCINRYDQSRKLAERIIEYCVEEEVPVLGLIPYDPAVITAVNSGRPVVEFPDSPAGLAIRNVWRRLQSLLFEEKREKKEKEN